MRLKVVSCRKLRNLFVSEILRLGTGLISEERPSWESYEWAITTQWSYHRTELTHLQVLGRSTGVSSFKASSGKWSSGRQGQNNSSLFATYHGIFLFEALTRMLSCLSPEPTIQRTARVYVRTFAKKVQYPRTPPKSSSGHRRSVSEDKYTEN